MQNGTLKVIYDAYEKANDEKIHDYEIIDTRSDRPY